MSSDIWILEKDNCEISLEITANQVGVSISVADPDETSTIFFDMRKLEERKALRTMIEVLQHQLEVHDKEI
jgi:hypothetical protein